jgi:acyl-CoA thioesterase FadM
MLDMAQRKESSVTTLSRYPSFEGANIATGIGFKHILYLAEDGVIHYFRERGWGPQPLYESYGLGIEIVHASVRLLTGINLDDLVRIEVSATDLPADRELSFSVQMFITRAGRDVKAAAGQWRVVLRQEAISSDESLPSGLTAYVTQKIDHGSPPPLQLPQHSIRLADQDIESIVNRLLLQRSNSFLLKRRIPYYYCHYNTRLQHSGYLRLLEEVVSLFLADRGISIRTMLETKGWVPIVINTEIEIVREAYMEENIYVVFTVENIFKSLTYRARVDFYVLRGTELFLTGRGMITHGYLEIKSRRDWNLASFDEATLAALSGRETTA